MSYPLVQFVASPDVDAEVFFDCNSVEDDRWVPREGFSFGMPTLEGDPDGISVEVGLRQGLGFLIYVAGFKSDAMAIKGALTRELNKRTGWLLVQLSEMSAPVWFRTYRTLPEATDVTNVDSVDDSDDVWSVNVRLNADAWAVGAEESFSLTLLNTVIGTAGEQQCVLPAIKGDVPTPIAFTLGEGVSDIIGNDDVWVSLAPQADTTRYRWAMTAEDSGSSAVASAPTSIAPGRYRVLGYQSAGVPVRFGWAPDGVSANTVWNAATPAALTTGAATWWDLGEVQFKGLPGDDSLMTPKVHVQRTTAGVGVTVRLMLVTVSDERIDEDGTICLYEPVGSIVGSARDQVWLGDDRTAAILHHAAGQIFQSPMIPRGVPDLLAYPQYENVFTGIIGMSGASSSITVTGNYRPQYVDVASS